MASLAGAWTALVEGFGGMRENAGRLCFDPALPEGISRLAFHLRWKGALVHVAVTHEEATYTVTGGSLVLHLSGEQVEVGDGETVSRPVTPRVPLLPEPKPPPGCEPRGRSLRGVGEVGR